MFFFDAALVFDPAARACDLALDEDHDLLIDLTAITPILMSVGLDRRAAPDDELPVGRSPYLQPYSLSERRGSPCDALDPLGEPAGCRTWLLDRAKETEVTRALFAFWLEEGMSWSARETGIPAAIEVEWVRPSMLGYRVSIDD